MKLTRGLIPAYFAVLQLMKYRLLANGRHIAYFSSGNNNNRLPLVLLHGFCEESSLWDNLLPYLPDQQIIRVDLPGFGGSDLPLTPGMESYAAAVCAVLNELNIQRCVLFGHSMGGYTALAFAQNYPERLAGFSLLHSHPFEDGPEQIENRRRGIEMLQTGKKDLYISQLFPGLFTPAYVKKHPEVVELLIQKGRQLTKAGIITALTGMMERKDHVETLKTSTCPVQFILGSLDGIVPLERTLAAAALPDTADIRVFPEVAHMGMFEAPEQTAQAIHEFWQFCQPASHMNDSNKTQISA